MTDQQLFDHPIPVETPLGHKCQSTPATQARWQFLRTKPKGSTWQEGSFLYRHGNRRTSGRLRHKLHRHLGFRRRRK